MCFIVHKTTLELEHVILTTLYFAGVENTDRPVLRSRPPRQHVLPCVQYGMAC
jgi:hypothetical protein